jgi:IclR family pca regulon transcriptional regulator
MKADDTTDAGAAAATDKTGSRYRIEALAKGLDVLRLFDESTPR